MAIALSKLILDRDFSFVRLFLNTENVLPLNNGENAEPWIQDKKYKRRIITKLQQQALEFCLLYDKIILYDGYAEIEIVNKNLSEFIEIKNYKEKKSFQLDKGSEIQTCFELKPITMYAKVTVFFLFIIYYRCSPHYFKYSWLFK